MEVNSNPPSIHSLIQDATSIRYGSSKRQEVIQSAINTLQQKDSPSLSVSEARNLFTNTTALSNSSSTSTISSTFQKWVGGRKSDAEMSSVRKLQCEILKKADPKNIPEAKNILTDMFAIYDMTAADNLKRSTDLIKHTQTAILENPKFPNLLKAYKEDPSCSLKDIQNELSSLYEILEDAIHGPKDLKNNPKALDTYRALSIPNRIILFSFLPKNSISSFVLDLRNYSEFRTPPNLLHSKGVFNPQSIKPDRLYEVLHNGGIQNTSLIESLPHDVKTSIKKDFQTLSSSKRNTILRDLQSYPPCMKVIAKEGKPSLVFFPNEMSTDMYSNFKKGTTSNQEVTTVLSSMFAVCKIDNQDSDNVANALLKQMELTNLQQAWENRNSNNPNDYNSKDISKELQALCNTLQSIISELGGLSNDPKALETYHKLSIPSRITLFSLLAKTPENDRPDFLLDTLRANPEFRTAPSRLYPKGTFDPQKVTPQKLQKFFAESKNNQAKTIAGESPSSDDIKKFAEERPFIPNTQGELQYICTKIETLLPNEALQKNFREVFQKIQLNDAISLSTKIYYLSKYHDQLDSKTVKPETVKLEEELKQLEKIFEMSKDPKRIGEQEFTGVLAVKKDEDIRNKQNLLNLVQRDPYSTDLQRIRTNINSIAEDPSLENTNQSFAKDDSSVLEDLIYIEQNIAKLFADPGKGRYNENITDFQKIKTTLTKKQYHCSPEIRQQLKDTREAIEHILNGFASFRAKEDNEIRNNIPKEATLSRFGTALPSPMEICFQRTFSKILGETYESPQKQIQQLHDLTSEIESSLKTRFQFGYDKGQKLLQALEDVKWSPATLSTKIKYLQSFLMQIASTPSNCSSEHFTSLANNAVRLLPLLSQKVKTLEIQTNALETILRKEVSRQITEGKDSLDTKSMREVITKWRTSGMTFTNITQFSSKEIAEAAKALTNKEIDSYIAKVNTQYTGVKTNLPKKADEKTKAPIITTWANSLSLHERGVSTWDICLKNVFEEIK